MRKVVRLIRPAKDGPVSLPKMLFEPGYARRLEAERDGSEHFQRSVLEFGGSDGSDELHGGSGSDKLERRDPNLVERNMAAFNEGVIDILGAPVDLVNEGTRQTRSARPMSLIAQRPKIRSTAPP